ncbi:DUF7344 domain-containing protein [Halorussus lipolyticus]|uniref:DUF7344 domain-containing protein n=1 Tax=Halorussus lipolyticus TaxID=3034024 RepID=UPI0023E7D613|nr:hypothetical protein [Halorussus sp. DT80]
MSEHLSVDANSADPSLEQTMQVLSDDYRREILTYLFDREDDDSIPVETLADHASDDREQVSESLYHTHLPRLDAAGIVAYDQSAERVELAGDQSSVEALLEAGRRVD